MTPSGARDPDWPLPALNRAFASLLPVVYHLGQLPGPILARDAVTRAADALTIISEHAEPALAGLLDEGLTAYHSFAGVTPPRDSRAAEPTELIHEVGLGFAAAKFLPRDFPQVLVGSFDQPAAGISIDLTIVPSLANFATTAGLHGATVEVPKPDESGSESDRRRTYTNFKLRVGLDPQATVYSNRLSFGQKRLFAFFWYLACIPEGVVLADELASGFHHSWIAPCLDQIGERQAILAGQNPLVLDMLTFADADQVRRSFVLCSLQDKQDGGRECNWHNMTSARAEDFFRTYKAGLQHVSEILRLGGWW